MSFFSWRQGRAAAAVLALGATLGACGQLLGLDDFAESGAAATSAAQGSGGEGAGGDGGAAGGDGGAGGGAGGSGTCGAFPPAEPDPKTEDGGTEKTADVVVALRTVELNEGDPLGSMGFDLDEHCTCELSTDAGCAVPSDAPEDPACDGPDGRDNATAKLLSELVETHPNLSSASASGGMEIGAYTVLIRLRSWSRENDDSEVDVALFPSPGLNVCVTAPEDVGPKWDGSDEWPVSAWALSDPSAHCGMPNPEHPDIPLYVAERAYVVEVEGQPTLVARFAHAGLAFAPRASAAVLSNAVLVATLEPVPGGPEQFRLRGVLAGRWKDSDLLGALTEATSLCTNPGGYASLKAQLCALRDIAAGDSSRAADCDALSFGMGFVAEPAKLGTVFVGSNGNCGDVNIVDTCD